MVDLEMLDKLEKAATPGPWLGSNSFVWVDPGFKLFAAKSYKSVEDARFVGEIRNAYPSLSAELRALRQEQKIMGSDNKSLCDRVEFLNRENEALREVAEAAKPLTLHRCQYDSDEKSLWQMLDRLEKSLARLQELK